MWPFKKPSTQTFVQCYHHNGTCLTKGNVKLFFKQFSANLPKPWMTCWPAEAVLLLQMICQPWTSCVSLSTDMALVSIHVNTLGKQQEYTHPKLQGKWLCRLLGGITCIKLQGFYNTIQVTYWVYNGWRVVLPKSTAVSRKNFRFKCKSAPDNLISEYE